MMRFDRLLETAGDWVSFGLRQQREAWQALVNFRDRVKNAITDIEKRLSEVAEFSAFEAFDLVGLQSKLEGLKILAAELVKKPEGRCIKG